MTRTEILNSLINKFSYRSYLEIGVQNPESNFDRIRCEFKTGVDPDSRRADIIPNTSDDFFCKLISLNLSHNISLQVYDLIFIDGLHHAEQLERDINNALECLSENGTILVHDVNPASEEMQKVSRETRKWTGDCWKSWVKLREERDDLEMFVIDAEYGNGIIRKGKQGRTIVESDHPTYQDFVQNKRQWLNLISIADFKKWLGIEKLFKIWQFVPYSLEGNLGQAYNEYVRLVPSDNDWVFLCDGDIMILTPGYLHLIKEIIERNPDVGLFTTCTNRVQSRYQVIPEMFEERDIVKHRLAALNLYDEYKYDLQEINHVISGYCMIFKKAVWKEVGGFVTDGILAVDNKFSSQILKSGRKIMMMKGVYALHYYRMLEGIDSKNHLQQEV